VQHFKLINLGIWDLSPKTVLSLFMELAPEILERTLLLLNMGGRYVELPLGCSLVLRETSLKTREQYAYSEVENFNKSVGMQSPLCPTAPIILQFIWTHHGKFVEIWPTKSGTFNICSNQLG
jgi:hypothetical protein